MNILQEHSRHEKNNKLQGYPFYPDSEDIYKKFLEERNIDPEEIAKIKVPNEKNNCGTINNKTLTDTIMVDDLDIPGSELDDQQESIGSEDEENNYYSLGSDEHNDLDENNGKF
jgi:hypothetical protein